MARTRCSTSTSSRSLDALGEGGHIDFIADRLTEAQRRQLILPHHALHAQRLEFTLQNQPFVFEAPPEDWFLEFLGS